MRRIVIPAFLLLIAGCAGEPEVYAIVQDRAYSPSEFRHASQNKDFPTLFEGAAFRAPRRVVWDAILDAMQPENWWYSDIFTPRTRFADRPAVDGSPYRVAVSVNPPPDSDPSGYCRVQDRPDTMNPEESTDSVTVRMAFCKDDAVLSVSRGTVEGIGGQDDPRFRKMITQMTMALFPARNDRNDRDCRPLAGRRTC
jgi:hypothetical protein